MSFVFAAGIPVSRGPSCYICFPSLPVHLKELWEEEAGVAAGKGRLIVAALLLLAACLKDQGWKNEEKGLDWNSLCVVNKSCFLDVLLYS